jgi:tetratricopeptide (TPR) repeat protein
MRNTKFNSLLPVAACICAGFASTVSAQLIDDIELRKEDSNAIVTVKFVTPVQYSKSISARASDLVQVYYSVIPTREKIDVVTSERRIPGGGGIPSLIVRDESAINTAQASTNRKLVIRFGVATRFKVRAGRNSRSIDIVLEGLGESVKSVVIKAPEALGGFVVTLQSSSEPGQGMTASVPVGLQGYQVFTARRVTEGKTVYDTNLGYFNSRQDAAAALLLLKPRFPDAVLVELPNPLVPSPMSANADAAAGPTPQAAAKLESAAKELLSTAQSAFDGGNYEGATESLNKLLNLPPNTSSRKAQELAGLSRLNAGDPTRASSEFELFLKLYPVGEDSDRIRQLLANLPMIAGNTTEMKKSSTEPTSTTSGSVSTFYYGGKSNVRTQEFQDSVLSSLPVLQSDNTLSSVDQRQVQTNADLNWRYRDADKDMRFVVRDAYTADLLNSSKSKERLSALYFDYRSLVNGTSFRVGRQSPSGGGVMYRFDGAQVGYRFQPKWKVNAVVGKPTDDLLDTRRTFYGLSLDAEALTPELNGSVYIIEQVIDGETDRRGLGTELRYFKGGLSASAQLDYDQMLKVVNIAAFQSTWQMTEATMINAMFDRRTTPMLSLGNVLFFQDPTLLGPAQRIQDLLGTNSIDTLRERVIGLTAYQTQARIGGTTTLTPKWQVGADFSLTSVDEIKPVADLLPTGQPSTGNLWAVGAQLIGSNLYSARDTHVFNVSLLGGPNYHGTLLSYNNLSSLNEKWQLEPSVKYYTQSDNSGAFSDTGTFGFRGIYRVRQQVSIESEVTYEKSESTSAPTTSSQGNTMSSGRLNYYLGARFDF